jgi:stearoyl-CoA desaturase (delta-9 desaturase)
MTTSPDTINAAEATTRAQATTANQATPASAGTTGGSVNATARTRPRPARPDMADEQMPPAQRFLVGLFVAVPLAALAAAIPLLWGWGLGWHDVLIALAFYWLSGLGVTVGYHRYFTHGSFKAKTGLRVGLANAGCLSFEGPVFTGVSDHRRPHI